jgi:L-ascorbate oxidase
VQAALVTASDSLPADVRQRVRAELTNDLRLTSFVPHRDIRDAEVTGTQQLLFNIDVSRSPPVFMINGKPYDADRIDRTLILGGVDQWTLQSNFVGHPFHIHVNPFQVMQILDPQGRDVSVTGEANDPQYANLKGAWKDTLFVKQNYTIMMRTRYERYIGDFVLHCHILDHEDQGMMQNIRIALPDGLGGIAGHH